MSANELNSFLHSFHRPLNYSDAAWQEVIRQSKAVWSSYINGDDWRNQLDIPCKEAYLMLVNSNGQLIVKDESLLNYVKNEHVQSWIKRVEEIAYKALRDRKYHISERYFGKLIKLDGDNAMHRYRRAVVRIKLNNLSGALADLSDAIKMQAKVSKFYLKRAEVYRLLDVDHKAMTDLNTTLRLDPSNAQAYQKRGAFRLSLGDKAGGRLDLLRAEELSQNHSGDWGMVA